MGCASFMSAIEDETGSALLDPLKLMVSAMEINNRERIQNSLDTMRTRCGTSIDKIFMPVKNQNDTEELLSRFLSKVQEQIEEAQRIDQIIQPMSLVRRHFEAKTQSVIQCPRLDFYSVYKFGSTRNL